jgi:hypothetical protein
METTLASDEIRTKCVVLGSGRVFIATKDAVRPRRRRHRWKRIFTAATMGDDPFYRTWEMEAPDYGNVRIAFSSDPYGSLGRHGQMVVARVLGGHDQSMFR